jgi:DNA repair exonuclease SbcCD ATPase subunit
MSVGTAAALAAAVLVGAQPQTTGSSPPPTPVRQSTSKATRENVEAFIRRRMADLQRRHDALESALTKLESGADPGQVRDELQPTRQTARGVEGAGERRGEQPNRPEAEPRQKDPDARAADRERALVFIKEFMPRLGERLDQLRGQNPELAGRLLDRLSGKIDDLRATRAFDEDLFRLKVDELGGALEVMRAQRAAMEAIRRNAPTEELTKLKGELRTAIGAHFDQQIKVQERDADKLAERIERLRNEISARRAERDKAIERELESMTKRGQPGQPKSGG